MKRSDFIIEQVSNGWIVKRKDGGYDNHAHFRREGGCDDLVEQITRNKLPSKKYFRTSCKRLLSEEEFNRLKRSKSRYYNVNKGGKRR